MAILQASALLAGTGGMKAPHALPICSGRLKLVGGGKVESNLVFGRDNRGRDGSSGGRGGYLKKSLDRNTTGPLASTGPSKNLRDARSSIASRSRTNRSTR